MMQELTLTLDRRWKKPTYTIGRLYVDGELFCNTLEDRDRGLSQGMTEWSIAQFKVPGETAIPTGTYTIDMDTVSPKYSAVPWYMTLCGGRVPRLRNVRGFSGVLIHPGTTALDTLGCILVGRNTMVGRLTNSRETFARLYTIMKRAHEQGRTIKLEIR